MSQGELGPEHLEIYMQQKGIDGQMVFLDVPTPTVETAAAAVNAQPGQIVKSILFLVLGEPVLAISCGTSLIDRRAIARRFGTNRKQVKLAGSDEVIAIAGFPVGTVPPFGHRQQLTTLIDKKVMEQDEVYAGGGGYNVLVKLKAADIPTYTEAEILELGLPKNQTKGD